MSHERKKVLIAVIIISALVCLAACGYLVFRSFQMRQGAEEYSELQNSFYKQTDATVSADEAEDGLLPESELPVDFVSLMDVNPEVYAWITIPETKVNYPVLQSGEDDKRITASPERYILRSATSATGATGLRCCTDITCLTARCSPRCTNLRINPFLMKIRIFTFIQPTES